MNIEQGIWTISTGKGNRIYIKCNDEEKIMHPENIAGLSGLGIYGYENLKDLAVAILKFEKQKQYGESVDFAVKQEYFLENVPHNEEYETEEKYDFESFIFSELKIDDTFYCSDDVHLGRVFLARKISESSAENVMNGIMFLMLGSETVFKKKIKN